MIINHNMMAMNTHRQLGINNTSGAKSLEKLSSGFRINRAGDDAAGLAISEKMRGQIRGLNQASRNAQDGISLIQTAEGALNETHAILQRMRELAVQSATDTNTAGDRAKIQAEVDQLATEITRISNTTEFNTRNLLAGGLNTTFHIGANEGQNVISAIGAMDAFTLGVAGSRISAGTFTAGTTNIQSINSLGSGLTAQIYSVTTTKTASSAGTIVPDTGMNANTVGTLGNADAFTGDANVKLEIRVNTALDGTFQTFDWRIGEGGWTTGQTSGATLGTTGLTWTAGTDYATNGGDSGKILSVDLTAASYTAKLVDEDGDDVGSAVEFKYSATSAVIGNAATGETMQINFAKGGIVAEADTTLAVYLTGSTAASLGANGEVTTKATVAKGIDVSSQVAADKAITTINNAIETVSAERSKLGAYQNRLEHTIKNLDTSSENLQASESRIRDVDMAKEMMEFTKQNILQQAATAMLAQANMAPQAVLQLLRQYIGRVPREVIPGRKPGELLEPPKALLPTT